MIVKMSKISFQFTIISHLNSSIIEILNFVLICRDCIFLKF